MRLVLLIAALVVTLAPAAAYAQQVEIEAQPQAPERRPEIIVPGGPDQAIHVPESERGNPTAPAVPHEPAFFGPLSVPIQTATGTGRMGFAGWTSPNPTSGPAQIWRNHPGWFSLGFAIEWGGPPPAARPAAKPVAR
ncbi:MAG: hypothetical protein HY294_14845 [Candidatus Rokubacteria bacterium]|nr:hypothetical protein [Candidatus Rokubacteria bacterium]